MGLRYKTIQTNGTAGEISPRLKGRVDFAKYFNAFETCLNMKPYIQGGLTRREGTKYVSEVKDSSVYTRIIPFKFSTTQNYVIELGNLYMRFCRNRGQVVESTKTITGITQANPGVVTSAGHGYSNGDQFFIESVAGMTQLNGLRYTATNVTANTLELSGVNTTSYTAYSSGGTMQRIYTVVTPWPTSVLKELKFTQSADTLYVSHPLYQTRKITRTSDTSWTISLYDALDGPYLPTNTTATTITPGAFSGTGVTLTASTSIFASTDVGRLVRMKVGSNNWGYAKITAYTSGTQVTADIINTLTTAAATTSWRLGAWSDTTGWPSVCAFFQERLYFGSTTNQPQTIWGSVTGDFENHRPSQLDGTVRDDDAVDFTIADDQVNAICWLNPGRVLNIGTRDAEFSLFGGQAGSQVSVTPTNVSITRETTYGSTPNVRVRRVGNSVIFTQPSKRRVRELSYNFRVDAYEAEDLTLFSDHITNSGITDFDYQEEIDPSIWMTLGNGTLVGVTRDALQQVTAWHKHTIGGTSAKAESIAVIPNPSLAGDDVWMTVSRTIGGTTKRYIEYITDPYDPDNNGQDSSFFVDSGLMYNGYLSATLTPGATTGTGITFTASASVFTSDMVGRKIKATNGGRATITGYTSGTQLVCTITTAFPSVAAIAENSWSVAVNAVTGLHHLNGETVQISVDGATHPNAVVASGSVSLDSYYSKVTAGYSYTSRLKTLPPEVQLNATAQGSVKSVDKIYLFFHRSSMCKFGKDENNLEVIPNRSSGDLMDAAVPLYTGVKELSFPGGYESSPQVVLQQDLPLPLTILYIVKRLMINE